MNLETIEQITAERDELRAQMEALKDPATVLVNILRGNIAMPRTHEFDELERERDELRARLAEYEQAPTVATVVSDSNRDDYWYTLDAGKLPQIGTELIARPTRKGE